MPSVQSLLDLPATELARLFWDVDPTAIDPGCHEDFVLARLLCEGDWGVVRRIRELLGDAALGAFVRRAGHRLDRRTRRFFEVVLALEPSPCASMSSMSLSGLPFRR
jgi:hypothetical protein